MRSPAASLARERNLADPLAVLRISCYNRDMSTSALRTVAAAELPRDAMINFNFRGLPNRLGPVTVFDVRLAAPQNGIEMVELVLTTMDGAFKHRTVTASLPFEVL